MPDYTKLREAVLLQAHFVEWGLNLTITSFNTSPAPERDACAEASRSLADLDQQLSHYQREAAKLPELMAAAEAATEELEHYASRSATRGEAPTADGWLERGEAKRKADAALCHAQNAEGQFLELAQRRPALLEALKQAQRHVILEEGRRLAEQRRRLSRAAERARAGLEVLAQYAAYTARDSGLAVQLQDAGRDFPKPTMADPGAFDRARRAQAESMAAFRQAWANFPERLASDPAATGPDPENPQ